MLGVGTLLVKVVPVVQKEHLLVEQRVHQARKDCIENLFQLAVGRDGCCEVHGVSKQHYSPLGVLPCVVGFQDDHGFQRSFEAGTQFEVVPVVDGRTI